LSFGWKRLEYRQLFWMLGDDESTTEQIRKQGLSSVARGIEKNLNSALAPAKLKGDRMELESGFSDDFPDPLKDDPGDLVAVGGDLSADRLIAAYSKGIFPWYGPGGPILWWSPDPRLILVPQEIHVARRLKRVIRQGRFELSVNMAFERVIQGCACTPRKGGGGTWITPEMRRAYVRLHRLGVAHSVEAWSEGRLGGGIYGLALGRAFFGESMFTTITNGSKVALVCLSRLLAQKGFTVFDCQQTSAHLLRCNAFEVPRRNFLQLLQQALAAGPPDSAMWVPRTLSWSPGSEAH